MSDEGLIEFTKDWGDMLTPFRALGYDTKIRRLAWGRLSDERFNYGYDTARYVLPPDWAGSGMHDGEWWARLPHEGVEHDGYWVPLYAPDPEREAFYADPRNAVRHKRWRVLRRRSAR